ALAVARGAHQRGEVHLVELCAELTEVNLAPPSVGQLEREPRSEVAPGEGQRRRQGRRSVGQRAPEHGGRGQRGVLAGRPRSSHHRKAHRDPQGPREPGRQGGLVLRGAALEHGAILFEPRALSRRTRLRSPRRRALGAVQPTRFRAKRPHTASTIRIPVTDPDTEDELEARLRSLPAEPGCYLFSDRSGELLYVGKAKNLRSRVRSYFQAGSSDTRAFIPFLRAQVGTFETIVTGSEKEAAILENNLIKERRPRYNVKLRDDKEYLSLRLDLSHEWPRPELVRRPKPDGARYFGPYHSATAARRTLHLVEKHFKLRSCSDRELASRKRPCLEYQIQRCPAPCVYDVDREQYTAQVRAVSLFLAGRHDE